MKKKDKVTEAELAFYRKHPERVHAFGDKTTTVLLQNYVEKKHREGRQYQREIMRQLASDQNKNQEEGQS